MKTSLLAAVLAFATNVAFAGVITNGNFATNDLSGWSSNGDVTVFNDGGTNVALLLAGLGQDVYTTLSQTLHLDAGNVLSGSAQFFSKDLLPFNDDAFVSINGVTLFFSNVAVLGNSDSSALTSFSFTALTAGDYVLTAGVTNRRDNRNASELDVRDFAVAAAVPEPTTLALFGLGLLGIAVARRKRASGNNK
jgi:PEP-CTERM motif